MLFFIKVAGHGISSLRQWGRALWSPNPLRHCLAHWRAKGQSGGMFHVGLTVKVKGVSRTSVIRKGVCIRAAKTVKRMKGWSVWAGLCLCFCVGCFPFSQYSSVKNIYTLSSLKDACFFTLNSIQSCRGSHGCLGPRLLALSRPTCCLCPGIPPRVLSLASRAYWLNLSSRVWGSPCWSRPEQTQFQRLRSLACLCALGPLAPVSQISFLLSTSCDQALSSGTKRMLPRIPFFFPMLIPQISWASSDSALQDVTPHGSLGSLHSWRGSCCGFGFTISHLLRKRVSLGASQENKILSAFWSNLRSVFALKL